MHCLIALAVAKMLVGGISLLAHQASIAVHQRMHYRLFDAQTAGHILPDVELNNGDFTDFGTGLGFRNATHQPAGVRPRGHLLVACSLSP